MHTFDSFRVRRLATVTAGAVLVSMFALVVSAAAATLPTAITGPVTALGSTTATVSGTVNPSGDATTWYAEYGTTTGYGTKTASASAGSGAGNVAVSASLAGLSSGTTYHYRIVATNAAGPTLGADGIFTTSGSAAPGAVTAAASNLTPTTATLNGTISPNGRATTYYFEYGKSTSYGTKTSTQNGGSDTSSVAVSASVSGLATGQQYHYRLVAMSDAGTTRGSDQSFTLLAAPTVTTNGASSVTSSGARLNGSVNPNGQSTTYSFEYGTTTSYGSRTTTGNAGSGTNATNVSATLTGLTGSTTFHYRLDASNASGTSVGSDQTFTLSAPPTVQTGTAQNGATSSVTLTGAVNPAGHSTNWYFEYGTTSGYGTKTPAKSAGSGTTATAVSTGITNLTPGTTYHYRLVASSSIGTAVGTDVTFTTLAAVTLSTRSTETVSGHYVTLSGSVSSGQPGVSVTVLAEPFGASSFSLVGTVLTGAGGTWTYNAQPKIRTTYQAKRHRRHQLHGHDRRPPRGVPARDNQGSPEQQVRRLDLVRRPASAASAPHAGWTLGDSGPSAPERKVLRDLPAAVLPRGDSTIRIAMSVNQAGPGFLAGFSLDRGLPTKASGGNGFPPLAPFLFCRCR